MTNEQELIVKALKLIRDCIYHLTIGKEGYNFPDIEELEDIIRKLDELEKEPK